MTAMKILIARKVFEHNGHQYLEKVWQTGTKSFELVRQSTEPYGVYVRDLTLWELLRWATACPEQVTLIRAH